MDASAACAAKYSDLHFSISSSMHRPWTPSIENALERYLTSNHGSASGLQRIRLQGVLARAGQVIDDGHETNEFIMISAPYLLPELGEITGILP